MKLLLGRSWFRWLMLTFSYSVHLKNKGEDKRSGVIASLIAAISAWQLLKKNLFLRQEKAKKYHKELTKKQLLFGERKTDKKNYLYQ